MATSSVTIVLPHGRRFTMKVTPNTSIQQLLEDSCKKAGLKPDETDLVHQKKVLDPCLTVRFANIPNNVSLELQPAKNGPKIQKLVTVGLQLESGERLLHDFTSSSTLWDVVQHGIQTKGESFVKGDINAELVCIYMRKEIIGENDLIKTTLNSLGITGGRVMIRLIYRIPSSLKEQAYVEDINLKKTVEIENWGTVGDEIEVSETNSNVGIVKNIVEAPVAPVIESSINENSKEKESNEKPTEDSTIKLMVEENQREYNGSTITDVEMEELENDEKMEDETEQEEKLIYIGERDALLFNMEDVPILPKTDLPEEFFEHTERDVRYLYSDIKKQLHELEEKPLMLSSQISQKKEEKALRYKNAIVRVHFPNRLVLQAKFDPRDKISVVKQFLRQFLIEPDLDFYLYTSPPINVLNEEMSLYEGDLVPAALVHFGSNQKEKTIFLKEDVRNKVSTLKAASRNARTLWNQQDPLTITSESVPSTSTIATFTSRTLQRDQKGLENVNQSRPVTKNPPKWFKLGKSIYC